MTQIYESTPAEIRELARLYCREGIWSRAAQYYGRLMFLGNLHRMGYLRLALISVKQGKENAAERVLNRYKAIYKDI